MISESSGSVRCFMDSSPDRHPSARFPTTHWSRVVAAVDQFAPEAQEALADLCRAYWYPLYAFIRRKGYDPDSAEDLVQGLFAGLLERDALRNIDPARGRFRSFLMACCVNHLSRHREHEQAQKRGGGRTAIPIDRLNAEARLGSEPFHELTPERLFERQWAMTLLDRVLGRLDGEMERSPKLTLYRCLRPTLLGQETGPPYSEVAASLGLTEGAVKMAASRLRGRYRQLLRDEIGRTVADPAEVDEEIAALLAAIGT
jgi:RNA polymerase sigma factor (sigma-70 family)